MPDVKATPQPPKYSRVIANPLLLAFAAVVVAFIVSQITSKSGGVDVCSLIVEQVSSASRVAYPGKLSSSNVTHRSSKSTRSR